MNSIVAPSDARRAWFEGELVAKMGIDGYECRRSWIAAAPTDELPPRMRIDVGNFCKADKLGMFEIGISRPSW